MATLQLNNITKRFGDTAVIKGINLEVNDREFVVFVGPSGCGKSTLMRIIAGLESATDGDIVIDGQRMNDVGPADRGLAMVFQSYALYPHMTVEGNMGFSMRLAGVPKRSAAPRCWKPLKYFSLSRCLTASPRRFPAVSASAWRLVELSCATRVFSCLMSRFPTWMPRCAYRCVLSLPACTKNSTPV